MILDLKDDESVHERIKEAREYYNQKVTKWTL